MSTKDPFDNIFKRRALPGILIFDLEGRLLYVCRDMETLLGGLDNPAPRSGKKQSVPKAIYRLCKDIGNPGADGMGRHKRLSSTFSHNGRRYVAMGMPLFRQGDTREPCYKMVIVEKYAFRQRLELDYVKCTGLYNLTRREIEVIRMLIKGLSNREIASALSISGHTVKEHVKNIMAKLGVNKRAAVITKVL